MAYFNCRPISLSSNEDAKSFLKDYIHCDDYGVANMSNKTLHYNILVENVSDPGCHILKQAMLSSGGDCAVCRDVLVSKAGKSNVLLMGTIKQFRNAVKNLKVQQFKMPILAEELMEVIKALSKPSVKSMDYDKWHFEFGNKTWVMGILNLTPDSFSDGGSYLDKEKAIEHAYQMIEEGADIIDIGGESTRPGHVVVGADEEYKRVIPIVEALAAKINVPISVDTYKASIARAALCAGAAMINDVWGLMADAEMAKVVAEYQCPTVVMHNKNDENYEDFYSHVFGGLQKSIDLALEAGLSRNKIIIDPGYGFGKNAKHNLSLMSKAEDLLSFDCPILIGTSRKRTIGEVLDLPVDDRVEGTAATVAIGISKGADIVRVHDVKYMTRIAKMTDAIVRSGYCG